MDFEGKFGYFSLLMGIKKRPQTRSFYYIIVVALTQESVIVPLWVKGMEKLFTSYNVGSLTPASSSIAKIKVFGYKS
jgi:hypothetical protein